MNKIKTNYGGLITLMVVFFFWGFIAAGNGVFIPFCKHKFHLDQFESQLVDFAFYIAYFVGALFLFFIGSFINKDLIGSWGYKKSIIYGLILSFLGAMFMIYAININSFHTMLVGLFILALGFAIQQTAAQPFCIILGDPATATGRINFCGGINSLGTTIGPIVVAIFLFGQVSFNDSQINTLSLNKVIYLYSFVGLLFVFSALLFFFSKKVPPGIMLEKTEPAHKALILFALITILLIACFVPIFKSYNGLNIDGLYVKFEADLPQKIIFELYRLKWTIGALLVVIISLIFAFISSQKNEQGWGALKYPQLVLGMLGIFFYVGVEVTIQSNLGELLKKPKFGNLNTAQIAPYISMYWGGLMMGRWAGAISAFELKSFTKKILTVFLPILAFLVVIGLNQLGGFDIKPLLIFIICVGIQILAFLYTKGRPAMTLKVFGFLGVLSMIVGLLTIGNLSIFSFLMGGICCSIMWPGIFSLSLAGLNKYTTQGSAFLIMMILGGGIIPPIQGKLADFLQSFPNKPEGYGIHLSYIVPLIGFSYIFIFGIIVKNILKKQNIDYEKINPEQSH